MNYNVYIIRFDSWALTALEFVCTLEQVNYDRFINGCGRSMEWTELDEKRDGPAVICRHTFVFDNDSMSLVHMYKRVIFNI